MIKIAHFTQSLLNSSFSPAHLFSHLRSVMSFWEEQNDGRGVKALCLINMPGSPSNYLPSFYASLWKCTRSAYLRWPHNLQALRTCFLEVRKHVFVRRWRGTEFVFQRTKSIEGKVFCHAEAKIQKGEWAFPCLESMWFREDRRMSCAEENAIKRNIRLSCLKPEMQN